MVQKQTHIQKFEKKKYACPNKTASIYKHTRNLSFNELVHLCGCWLVGLDEGNGSHHAISDMSSIYGTEIYVHDAG